MQSCNPTAPYSRKTPQWWIDAVDQILDANLWTDTDSVWSVTFECPYCCHPIGKTLYYEPRIKLVEEDVPMIAIRCQCTQDHEGRDKDKTGCGCAGAFVRPDFRMPPQEDHDVG